MLTSITIQNFKGIGDSETIPIRPLTIMFGKNSAGKSTLIQALHYAREVLLNSNPNADRTALGGTAVDLGGFRTLVHKNEYRDRIVRMKFDFDISLREFPEYDDWDADLSDLEANLPTLPRDIVSRLEAIREPRGRNLYDEIHSLQGKTDIDPNLLTASVEFSVQWSQLMSRPVISEYRTFLCGELAGRIQTSLDLRKVNWEVNINNRLLVATEDSPIASEPRDDGELWMPIVGATGPGLTNSLPKWGRPLYVMPYGELYGELGIGYETISQLILGPGELLIGYLQEPGLSDFRYIGPLRETPPREFSPPRTGDASGWANGTAAWANVFWDEDVLWDSSDWLGSEHLATGYTLEVENFREIPLESELHIGLANNDLIDRVRDTAEVVRSFPIRSRLCLVEEKSGLRFEPHDIGVGVSQVVPVVVAATASSNQFVAIEQPELHLHPAMQAELGDLFITSMNERSNVFFLETHSEHLILRALRRIRETTAAKEELPRRRKLTPDDVSLLFVGEGPSNSTEFLSLRIDKRGRIVDRVPGGFFEEDFAEIF